jgi:hypothetical protein
VDGPGNLPSSGGSVVDREGDTQLIEALERLRSLGVMHSKVT